MDEIKPADGDIVLDVATEAPGVFWPIFVGVKRRNRTDGVALNQAEARELTRLLIAAGYGA